MIMDASIYRMRSADVLTVCVIALLALGVVMVQSASTTLSGCISRAAPIEALKSQPGSIASPANFTAVIGGGGVELSWDPDSHSAVIGCNLYRSESADKDFTLIATIKRPASRYEDHTAPAGVASYYRLATVDNIGLESTPASLSITRPGTWKWTSLGTRHLLYAAVALLSFLAIGHLDYAKLCRPGTPCWRSAVVWTLVGSGLLCALVLVPGVGTSVNGARRWIRLGPVQVQPSEMAKWSAVLFLAWWLARPRST